MEKLKTMTNQILIDIKNNLDIELTKENINDYYDIVYDFCMTNYGETSTETENHIDKILKNGNK